MKVVKLEAGDNFAVIQQEILMIRGCVHPNIIAYHGSYLRRDRLWIVMEYCSGGSLQDIYHSMFSLCFAIRFSKQLMLMIGCLLYFSHGTGRHLSIKIVYLV